MLKSITLFEPFDGTAIEMSLVAVEADVRPEKPGLLLQQIGNVRQPAAAEHASLLGLTLEQKPWKGVTQWITDAPLVVKKALKSVVVQFDVILSKRALRSAGSGRAARCVAFFATHQSRVRLASPPNCTTTLKSSMKPGDDGCGEFALPYQA
jgi:hypothetical protein